MKFASLFLILVLGLALAGCESISERMAERFDNKPPQTRDFPADQKTVFFAAQKALKRMDFVLTRSSQVQGIVNARSGVRDTAVFGAGRQFILEIHVYGADATLTHVESKLTDLLEGDFKAGVTGKTVRVHGLYDSFYEQLEQALREAATAAKPVA